MSLSFLFLIEEGKEKKEKTDTNMEPLFFPVTFTVSDKMFALPSYRANTPVLNRNWLQTGAQWRLNTAPLCLLCHPHILHTVPQPGNFSSPFCAVCFFLFLFFHVTFYSLGSVAGSTSNNYCLYMINLKPSCSFLSQQKEKRKGERGEEEKRGRAQEYAAVCRISFLFFF